MRLPETVAQNLSDHVIISRAIVLRDQKAYTLSENYSLDRYSPTSIKR